MNHKQKNTESKPEKNWVNKKRNCFCRCEQQFVRSTCMFTFRSNIICWVYDVDEHHKNQHRAYFRLALIITWTFWNVFYFRLHEVVIASALVYYKLEWKKTTGKCVSFATFSQFSTFLLTPLETIGFRSMHLSTFRDLFGGSNNWRV